MGIPTPGPWSLAMTATDADRPLPEDRRREIFAALVEAQDRAVPVAASRKAVAERFGIDERELREIEREGLNETWPPL
jgi:hypothetical protein